MTEVTAIGDQVRFVFRHAGSEYDNAQAEKHLRFPAAYTVKAIRWYPDQHHDNPPKTMIMLHEVPDVLFNAAHFTDVP